MRNSTRNTLAGFLLSASTLTASPERAEAIHLDGVPSKDPIPSYPASQIAYQPTTPDYEGLTDEVLFGLAGLAVATLGIMALGIYVAREDYD